MRHAILPVVAVVLAATPLLADVVHLRDGRTVEGKLRARPSSGWVLTDARGRVTAIDDADVTAIDVSRSPGDPAARLASLRSAAGGWTDAAVAVDRYQRLISDVTDAATLAAAKSDLAVWQDRVDRHLCKLNDKWVLPEARRQAAVDSLVTAEHARQLIKGGQFAAADPLLASAVAVDPQNASAWYLTGLSRSQQNQLITARKAFETADSLVPNHGPTLNNLAVVLWREHRYVDALDRFHAAMAAAPIDAVVLANVSAALAERPMANTKVGDKVRQRFDAEWRALAQRMAAAGMHPAAGAWLTDAQWADLQRVQDADLAELDDLTARFDQRQDAVRATDLQLAEVEQRMRQSAHSGVVSPYLASYDGDRPIGELSSVYFELRNDADQLQQRRAKQVAELDRVAKQAVAIRERMAGRVGPPRVQRLIGAEGTPLRVPG